MSGNVWADVLDQGLIETIFGQKKEMVAFNVVAGETYYLKMSSGIIREKMERVPPERGEKEIKNCRWVNLRAEDKP